MIKKIGLGGGCHWCTEAVFQKIPGVIEVKQGYIKSRPPADDWSEAVIVTFEETLDLKFLLEVHLATHNATSNHSRRKEYRSAVYYFNEDQSIACKNELISLSRKRNENYITQILEFVKFKPSRESVQDYYRTRPDAPFCKRYIAPKLEKVKHLLAARHS